MSYCAFETTGPSTPVASAVAASSGSQSGIALAHAARRRRKAGAIFSWISSRLVAEQIWPLVQKQPKSTHSTALSSSASDAATSSKTITADLPPSSRLTLRTSRAAAAATATPERSDPVNATLSTRGCAASHAPTAPPPGSTLRRPAGSPASVAMAPSCRWSGGVESAENCAESAHLQRRERRELDGLRTTAQPAASAGATFHAAMSSG